jgi:hypothetical protein
MTSNEFVLWLKGFTEGVHEFNVTPKQWDTLKTKLAEVEDKVLVLESPSFPIYPKQPNTAPNTHPFPTWQHPHYVDPYNPYKITSGTDTTLTVSTGSSGTIVATPGYGSITYNPSTTTQMYPSGSAWSYTNNTGNNKWNEYQATMAQYKPYQPYTTGGPDEVIKHHNED